MKNTLSLIMLLSISVITKAQSAQENEVATAVEKLRIAMIDGNRTALENIASDKLSYGHSGGHIDDKKEFVEKLASGNSDFVSINLSEQTISISGNTAIVRHILTAKTLDGGKPADVHIRILLVWQKMKNNWVLLARQAVKIT